MEIIRATETWQQAGAYYVRIQAMAKKHHITLRQEFLIIDRNLRIYADSRIIEEITSVLEALIKASKHQETLYPCGLQGFFMPS